MEKAEYKEQLDVACEKFRKLMADQLTRVEDMKAQGDFVDYGALDCIKIGVCGGDAVADGAGRTVRENAAAAAGQKQGLTF